MKKAPTDALTGALSRDTLDAALREALEQSRAEQLPVALLLIDVDYLKLINDAFGHLAGDGALVTIAKALRVHLREHDRLFRYGGDEFVVLLPRTSAEDAYARANDMLAHVCATPYVPKTTLRDAQDALTDAAHVLTAGHVPSDADALHSTPSQTSLHALNHALNTDTGNTDTGNTDIGDTDITDTSDTDTTDTGDTHTHTENTETIDTPHRVVVDTDVLKSDAVGTDAVDSDAVDTDAVGTDAVDTDAVVDDTTDRLIAAETADFTEDVDAVLRRSQVTLSLSIGVSHTTVAADAVDLVLLAQYLFEQADQCAYVAKRAGRGQVSDSRHLAITDDRAVDVRLLGREGELEQLRQFLSAALSATVIPALKVRGQAGMGVSRLLHYAKTLSQLMGEVVVTLQGSFALSERKLGALSEAQLSVSWLDWQDLTEPKTVRRKLAEHVPNGQLLVIVDRVEFLDETSRHYLHSLLALTMPIRLIYSVVDEQGQRVVDSESDLHKFVEVVDTIILSALSFDEVWHWLQGRLGEQLAPVEMHPVAPASLVATPPDVRTPDEAARQQVQMFVRGVYDITRGVPARVSTILTALEMGLVVRSDPLREQLTTLRHLLEGNVRRSNLPMSRGVFVGRYEEVAVLKRWLRAGALVSVVGADGMGKSRLVLQAARECTTNFLGGVYWLSLPTLTSYNELMYTLAETMRVPFGSSQDPAAPVFNLLQQAPTLLVLDDVTVLPPVLELIGNIQQHAPSTALCITSQVSLKLTFERVLQLPNLPEPTAGAPALNSSVSLFLEYARQAAPSRNFDIANAAFLDALQQIYKRVSATPLGLELAAAWCGVYDVPAIAALLQEDALRLDDTPDTSAVGANVRVMLEAFWSLLSDHEQQVLASLAVFPSYFAEDVARDVAGASPFFLTSLWHKSFLNHRAAGSRSDDGRYHLPLLLRQFVGAKLAAQTHWQQQVQQAFVHHYVRWLQALEPTLWDNRQRRTFELLHNDIENISQAWRWLPSLDAIGSGSAAALDVQGKATMLLRNYFEVKGHAQRGAQLFTELSDYFSVTQPRVASFHAYAAARLWSRAGSMVSSYHAIRHARSLLERCSEPPEGFQERPWFSILEATNALFSGVGRDIPVILDVGLGEAARLDAMRPWISGYIILGWWYQQQDDIARAQQILRRSEVMARRLGSRTELCRSLHHQGMLYVEQGAWQQAKRAFKVGLERATLITYNRSQALCCMGLARCLSQSNALVLVNRRLPKNVLTKILAYLDEAIVYVEHSGSIIELLQVLRERASLAYASDDIEVARGELVRALTIAKNSPYIPSRLQMLAILACYEDMRADILPLVYAHAAASVYFRRKLREQFPEVSTWPTERLSPTEGQEQLEVLSDTVLVRLQQAGMARAS